MFKTLVNFIFISLLFTILQSVSNDFLMINKKFKNELEHKKNKLYKNIFYIQLFAMQTKSALACLYFRNNIVNPISCC